MTYTTFVSLDVETTGLDPERDRITEIGAVRFSADGAVIETFDQLVNPGRDIPFFIEQLTGISNDTVRAAPAIAAVANDLRSFVGIGPVVGHNIGFDLACLDREGVTLGVPGIDTADLSRYLLPERQARGLIDVATALGVEAGDHHRALPDARTAAAVFGALQRRAAALPTDERRQLARFVALHDATLAEVIAGDEAPEEMAPAHQLPIVQPAPDYVPLVRREPRVPIPASEIDRAFAAASGVMELFEERAEQREMAQAVRTALSEGGHWLIEAGTGVGKSLAYLLPAALHAIRNGERVVISTNTHNLQEQLLTKDIPALRDILTAAGVIREGGDLRATLLKGRANYLCLRRWIASYGAGLGDPDFARLAASMLLWLPETTTGDRSELNLDHDEYLTWQRFSAQDTDCLARQNTFVREGTCFLQRARKSAESAHIIVVNHALLLADLASGGSAIPAYEHLIIDEAHNLEDTATQQFGGTISRRILGEALDGLHRRGGRDQREGGVAALLKAFPEGAATIAAKAIEDAVARAHASLPPLFEALAAHLPRRGEDDRVLVTRSLRAREPWTVVENAWAAVDRALRTAVSGGTAAVQAVAATKLAEESDALAGEIETATRKLDDARALLELLMATTGDETIVWVGRERDGSGSLNSAPLEVGPRLWEDLFSRKETVVATSATLSAAGSMAYSARRLGFDEPEALQLGSPFDYRRSTLLAAFTDIPEPNDPAYTEAVARAIVELARSSGGRALALFTSHAALRAAAAIVRPALEPEGIVTLAQGIDGTPRQLTDALKTNPRTVLLGTSSFWEGVDIRGEALSMLIIARLPFSVPTDPIYKARSEQYDNPFGQYALPAAILRFRQGFGRLIRDRNDRGVVAVLDRRIWAKGYGGDFVNALPDCTKFRATTAEVAIRAREWLQ